MKSTPSAIALALIAAAVGTGPGARRVRAAGSRRAPPRGPP